MYQTADENYHGYPKHLLLDEFADFLYDDVSIIGGCFTNIVQFCRDMKMVVNTSYWLAGRPWCSTIPSLKL